MFFWEEEVDVARKDWWSRRSASYAQVMLIQGCWARINLSLLVTLGIWEGTTTENSKSNNSKEREVVTEGMAAIIAEIE